MGEEGLKETPNKMIHIGKPIDMDYEKFREDLKRLMEISNNDSETIKKTVAKKQRLAYLNMYFLQDPTAWLTGYRLTWQDSVQE